MLMNLMYDYLELVLATTPHSTSLTRCARLGVVAFLEALAVIGLALVAAFFTLWAFHATLLGHSSAIPAYKPACLFR
jgi:hypothetical protein